MLGAQPNTERKHESKYEISLNPTSKAISAIGNFVANTPTTMAPIREAYEGGDTDPLRQVAHKLAGGALNLGVTGAGEIAQRIELVADTGSVGGAGALVEELSVALEDGRAALLAYQASYSG